MSQTIHRSHERGIAEHGWLHSRFSFSFAEYHNPERMGFGALRVINDDVIEAGMGFGMHPHRDMEIVTIVTKGAIEHRDSQGHHGITRAGEVQYMCAGSGIHHSEYATPQMGTELFQIWIFPDQKALPPHYEQRDFSHIADQKGWHPLVSGDGRGNSLRIHQDAAISIARLEKGEILPLPPVPSGRGLLLFVMEGDLRVCGTTLSRRDEMQITEGEECSLTASEASKVLLFDMPMRRS